MRLLQRGALLEGCTSQGLASGGRAASDLGELLGNVGLRSVYQPIVDLETGVVFVFGFEGLARAPEG
jgi:EAL domain-containing protein (putative c-di-GMP-specific phosphodiesterase class I)